MRQLKYVVYQEDKYYVAQCLNVDVSSFGATIDESIANLQEAVELYLEDAQDGAAYHQVGNTLVGEFAINA